MNRAKMGTYLSRRTSSCDGLYQANFMVNSKYKTICKGLN